MDERTSEKMYRELSKLREKRDSLKGRYFFNPKRYRNDEKHIEAITLALAERYETIGSNESSPDKFIMAAEEIEHIGHMREEIEDFRGASKMYQHSAKLREKASILLGEGAGKRKQEYWADFYKTKAVKDRKRATLYEKTKNMNSIKRTLIRKLRSRYLMILFMLSLLSLPLSLTGFTIKTSSFNTNQPYLSILLFAISLFLSYFYIQQNRLSK